MQSQHCRKPRCACDAKSYIPENIIKYLDPDILEYLLLARLYSFGANRLSFPLNQCKWEIC